MLAGHVEVEGSDQNKYHMKFAKKHWITLNLKINLTLSYDNKDRPERKHYNKKKKYQINVF